MDAGAGRTELGDRLAGKLYEKLDRPTASPFFGDQAAFAGGRGQEGPQLLEDSRGLELADVDLLLRRRDGESKAAGFERGAEETREYMQRSHRLALNEHVAATFEACADQVLATVVVAAVQAREANKTRDELVQAVTDAARRCGAALEDTAGRARRGELFG